MPSNENSKNSEAHLQRTLNTYDPKKDVIPSVYGQDSVTTSNGSAEYYDSIEGVLSVDQMVEGNHILTRDFLESFFRHERLQQRLRDIDSSGKPVRILEGGPGRGNSLSVYIELYKQGFIPDFQFTGVELSENQFKVQHQEAVRCFGEQNVYVSSVEELFSAERPINFDQLRQQYQCILIHGDFNTFLTESARRGTSFDMILMIESIIHMNRTEVVQRIGSVMAKGGYLGLSDLGIEERMRIVAGLIKYVLSKVNSITPELISWWREHFGEHIIFESDHTDDIRATTVAINKRLHDPEIYQRILKDLMDGGMSKARAMLKIFKDGLLFSAGRFTTTSYFLILENIERLAAEDDEAVKS